MKLPRVHVRNMLKLFAVLMVLLICKPSRQHIARIFDCKIEGNAAKYIQIKSEQSVEIQNSSNFDPSKPTYFILHGWLESSAGYWGTQIAKALDQDGANAILVDYKEFARKFYVPCAPTLINEVGNHLAKFIVDAIKTGHTAANQVHIVGQSLGAHVAGHAGRMVFEHTGNKIKRISGLEPSALLFTFPIRVLPQYGLIATDAEMVDVLHTTFVLGSAVPVGHLNFYVSLPFFGPCRFWDFLCGHGVSRWLYHEAITSCALRGAKRGATEEVIYGYHMPLNATGIYHLSINRRAPFGQSDPECPN